MSTWQTGIIAGVGEVAFEVVDEPPVGALRVRHLTMLTHDPKNPCQPWYAELVGIAVEPFYIEKAQLVVRGMASSDLVLFCEKAWQPRGQIVTPPDRKVLVPGAARA